MSRMAFAVITNIAITISSPINQQFELSRLMYLNILDF